LWARFFGGWDRALASVSLLASLIGTGVSLFLFAYPTEVPQFIIFRDLAIIFALLFSLIFMLIRHIRREVTIRAQIYCLSHQFTNAHMLIHNYRSELFKSYFTNVRRSNLSSDEMKLFRRVCHSITENTRTSLKDYFSSNGIDVGDDIHITIKLSLSPDDVFSHLPTLSDEMKARMSTNERWIVNAYRDYHTFNNFKNREVLKKIWSIERNTVYHHIITLENEYFLQNDLLGMGNNFHNENHEWRSQYNSILAAPIRYKEDSTKNYICYGILSADSLNRNGHKLFNDKECRFILGQGADLLATFFLLLALTSHQPIHD
jgi:hypothetical protein